MNQLSVIIPLREGASPEVTLRSLARQTFQDFEVILSQDEVGNANWARNRGYELSSSPLLLFSDDDITWQDDALEHMIKTLQLHPRAAYVYCGYKLGERIQCNREFNAQQLRIQNYISTMSIIRREKFFGWDEELQRLQDWALWLDMLSRGQVGVYCGRVLFETKMREGITYGGGISYQEAARIVKVKYLDKEICA